MVPNQPTHPHIRLASGARIRNHGHSKTYGVSEKHCPGAPAFEHVLPGGWHCFREVMESLGDGDLAKKYVPGADFESL